MNKHQEPKDMPKEWMISRFELYRGICWIKDQNGNEIFFDIIFWDPPELSIRGQRIASNNPHYDLPKIGERVSVEWKHSRQGKVIPCRVSPLDRKTDSIFFKVSTWLKEMKQITGRFQNMKVSDLNKALKKRDPADDDHMRASDMLEAEEFGDLLYFLAESQDYYPAWYQQHMSWVYIDDHRWDREKAQINMPVMLGLPPKIIDPKSDSSDEDEALGDYANRLNDIVLKGNENILCFFEIAHTGDYVVLILMTQAQAQKVFSLRLLSPWDKI